jgi:hypothetical protein
VQKVEGESLQKPLQSPVLKGVTNRKAARKPLKKTGSSGRTRTYNPSVNRSTVGCVQAAQNQCITSVINGLRLVSTMLVSAHFCCFLTSPPPRSPQSQMTPGNGSSRTQKRRSAAPGKCNGRHPQAHDQRLNRWRTPPRFQSVDPRLRGPRLPLPRRQQTQPLYSGLASHL